MLVGGRGREAAPKKVEMLFGGERRDWWSVRDLPSLRLVICKIGVASASCGRSTDEMRKCSRRAESLAAKASSVFVLILFSLGVSIVPSKTAGICAKEERERGLCPGSNRGSHV